MHRTNGTKKPAIVSASSWIGAFDVCASSTSLMICFSAVSWPTWVARMMIAPTWFFVPPTTWAPTVLSTGIASPVISDSSHVVVPSMMYPSVGIVSPGRTLRRSSRWMSWARMGLSSRILPRSSSFTSVPCGGWSASSFFNASDVLPWTESLYRHFHVIRSLL